MDWNGKRICVIVPAYNEALSLAAVLKSIKQYCPTADTVVVNDASTDTTKEVARQLATLVLNLPINLGIGGAMQTGFKFAAGRNYDIAIQVDGDGQHDPRYIADLVRPILANRADIVIGSRFLNKESYKSSLMRLIGIRLFSYLIGLATNVRIHDSTSGFRAYNKEALQFAARYYPPDFPEPESIVTFLRNNFRVREIPVAMKQRSAGISSVRPFKGTYFVASNAVAIIISSFKKKVR